MRRVLLTGATGFIGRQAIKPLQDRGFEVHAVSFRQPPPPPTGEPQPVVWYRANLLDPDAVKRVCAAAKASHLLHLAWDVTPGKFWTSPLNLRWVQASLELVLSFQAVGGKRAVIAGTCAEYDWTEPVLSDRISPTLPATLYGTCKHALRLMFEQFGRQEGLSTAWGRIFLIYGPHEHSSRLVSSVIQSVLRGQTAECTHGEQIRDFLHVGDLADAFTTLLDSPVEGAINLAAGTPVAIKDVVQLIGKQLGRPDLIALGARQASANEPARLTADIERLRSELGWAPKHDLASGLADTISSWKQSMTD